MEKRESKRNKKNAYSGQLIFYFPASPLSHFHAFRIRRIPVTNNIIFRKLRIALDLKAEDILEILDLAGVRISKHELSAFFRKPDHKHYRDCQDQILRNFLKGVQLKYHPDIQ